MYVPYLYGLSGELFALRDLAAVHPSGPVLPVVEPVNVNADWLVRAIAAAQSAGRPMSVVVNPSLREFSVPGAVAQWYAGARATLELSVVRPAFSIDSSTRAPDVEAFIRQFPSRPLTAVIRAGGLPAPQLARTIEGREVLVVVHHNVDDAGYVAEFGAHNVIRLTDSFIDQARNADYEGDDWFTAGHTTFAAAGRPGFGDYTVLGTAPSKPGGGPPGAVAIHATYLASDGDLWVRHYVSDTVDRNEGSAGSKLMEAMTKLHADRSMYLDSPGMLQFDAQYATRSPTSLGTNKRQQIAHHIYTAAAALT